MYSISMFLFKIKLFFSFKKLDNNKALSVQISISAIVTMKFTFGTIYTENKIRTVRNYVRSVVHLEYIPFWRRFLSYICHLLANSAKKVCSERLIYIYDSTGWRHNHSRPLSDKYVHSQPTAGDKTYILQGPSKLSFKSRNTFSHHNYKWVLSKTMTMITL